MERDGEQEGHAAWSTSAFSARETNSAESPDASTPHPNVWFRKRGFIRYVWDTQGHITYKIRLGAQDHLWSVRALSSEQRPTYSDWFRFDVIKIWNLIPEPVFYINTFLFTLNSRAFWGTDSNGDSVQITEIAVLLLGWFMQIHLIGANVLKQQSRKMLDFWCWSQFPFFCS